MNIKELIFWIVGALVIVIALNAKCIEKETTCFEFRRSLAESRAQSLSDIMDETQAKRVSQLCGLN